jgi:hypothetical protein
VRYPRDRWWKGGHFADLDDARAQAERWCRAVAGLRVRASGKPLGQAPAPTEQHRASASPYHYLKASGDRPPSRRGRTPTCESTPVSSPAASTPSAIGGWMPRSQPSVRVITSQFPTPAALTAMMSSSDASHPGRIDRGLRPCHPGCGFMIFFMLAREIGSSWPCSRSAISPWRTDGR